MIQMDASFPADIYSFGMTTTEILQSHPSISQDLNLEEL
jgi:hypothetical protein